MSESKHLYVRPFFAVLLAMLQLPLQLPAKEHTQNKSVSSSHGLKIFVLQGERASNFIPDHTGTTLVVEVRDINELPVGGVAVEFRMPQSGPGGTFENGTFVTSAITNTAGQVQAPFTVRTEPGVFDIQVAAKIDTRSATTVISQFNTLKPDEVYPTAKTWYKNWKILAAIGAVTAGVVLAVVLTRDSGSSTTSSGSTVGLTPGTPTFGTPH